MADDDADEAGDPRNAMKPKGVPMIAKAINAPIVPYGAAANTSKGLTAFLMHEQSE